MNGFQVFIQRASAVVLWVGVAVLTVHMVDVLLGVLAHSKTKTVVLAMNGANGLLVGVVGVIFGAAYYARARATYHVFKDRLPIVSMALVVGVIVAQLTVSEGGGYTAMDALLSIAALVALVFPLFYGRERRSRGQEPPPDTPFPDDDAPPMPPTGPLPGGDPMADPGAPVTPPPAGPPLGSRPPWLPGGDA